MYLLYIVLQFLYAVMYAPTFSCFSWPFKYLQTLQLFKLYFCFISRATADISDPYIEQLQLLTTNHPPIMSRQATPTNQAPPTQQQSLPKNKTKQKKKAPSPRQQKPRVCIALDFLQSVDIELLVLHSQLSWIAET